MTAEALNRTKTYFEDIVGWMPSELQCFTRAVLWPFEQLLEMVSGDPHDLDRAANECQVVANAVRNIASSHATDRRKLSSHWQGDAADAFQESMSGVEQAIEALAQGLEGAATILIESATAAAEAFNLILEIIVEFLVAWLIEYIIAAALSVVTAGASVLSWIAETFGTLALSVGRGARVAQRLSSLLMRLSAKIKKVAELLVRYRKYILKLRERKKAFRLWNSTGYTKAAFTFKAERFAAMFPAKFAINTVSPVNLSGYGGAALDTATGLQDISDGSKDRNYLTDGTYRAELGKYTKGAQDVIDAVFN